MAVGNYLGAGLLVGLALDLALAGLAFARLSEMH